jgi:N6-L-threonylcarbamoyladenine synthase
MQIILGIETSCDETAVAIINDKKETLAHVISSHNVSKYGGIVPEIISRGHENCIVNFIEEALDVANISYSDLTSVAATAGPGLSGGLWVGLNAAKSISSIMKIPLIAVNHVEAHLLMPRYFDNDASPNSEFPFIAVLLSGGHSLIVYAEEFGKYKILGKSLDDSVGECFDKVARTIGLEYPGGPEIEKRAQKGDHKKYNIPFALKEGINMSFSGIKTFILRLWEKESKNPKEHETLSIVNDISASFQSRISEIIFEKITNAIKITGCNKVIVSGGVASNKNLRQKLEPIGCIFPPIEYCTDNGVMIAWAGYERLSRGFISDIEQKIMPSWSLD